MRMDPLATYREWRVERKCDFELYLDSIRVVGRTSRGHFETKLPLTILDPNFERLWVFGTLFYAGVMLFLIALIALGMVVFGRNPESFAPPAPLIFFITLSGFALAIFNSRKVELVRFRSVVGVPMLDVVRVTKQSAEFDAFISRLIESIDRAKAET